MSLLSRLLGRVAPRPTTTLRAAASNAATSTHVPTEIDPSAPKLLVDAERFPRRQGLLCPHCEKAMEAGHDVDRCARKRMSRRYFFGMMAAAAVAPAIAKALPKPTGGLFDPTADVALQFDRAWFTIAGRGKSAESLTMQMVEQYGKPKRWDVLFGIAKMEPDLSCVIVGSDDEPDDETERAPATLITDGWSAAPATTFRVGDTFTIPVRYRS